MHSTSRLASSAGRLPILMSNQSGSSLPEHVPAGRAHAHGYVRTHHTRASGMGAQWRHGIGEGITNNGEVRPSQHHADMVFRSDQE
ncbi:hypothetical protein [Marinobacter sp.]|uniref:hypothetical protein n=1 Tax=Marinobacter sp. TaxID=50741 RepID=UPI003A9294CB